MDRLLNAGPQQAISKKMRKGLLILILAAMMALSLTPAFAGRPINTTQPGGGGNTFEPAPVQPQVNWNS